MLTRHLSRRTTRGSNPRIREISIPDRRKHKKPRRSKTMVEEDGRLGQQLSCRIKVEDEDSSPPVSPDRDGLYNVKQECFAGGLEDEDRPPPDSSDRDDLYHVKQEGCAGGCGFARGLEVQEIVGISDAGGFGLRFLVRWEGDDRPEFVPAAEANRRCPREVIAFYERRCFFEAD